MMHIEKRKVTVHEVIEGYFNDDEEGVISYILVSDRVVINGKFTYGRIPIRRKVGF